MVGDRVASVGERLPLCVGRFLDGLRPWEAAGQREAVTALQAFERGLGSAGRHCPCVRGVEKYPGPSFRLSKQPGPDGRKRRAATARAGTLSLPAITLGMAKVRRAHQMVLRVSEWGGWP
jgi:hypothetical protein